jgi:arsenate reductase (glutaredoxin)
VLAMIRQSGEEPVIVEYLKSPPTRERLKELIAAMGIPDRALLREKGTPYAELGLNDPKWTDDQLLGFMLTHPILINRPRCEQALQTVSPLVSRARPRQFERMRLPKTRHHCACIVVLVWRKRNRTCVFLGKRARYGKLSPPAHLASGPPGIKATRPILCFSHQRGAGADRPSGAILFLFSPNPCYPALVSRKRPRGAA